MISALLLTVGVLSAAFQDTSEAVGAATSAAPSQPQLTPEKTELLALYQSGNFQQFERRLLDNAVGKGTPQDRMMAFGMLVSARKEEPRIAMDVVDQAFEAVKGLRPELPQSLQYELDHYAVDRFILLGDGVKAAWAAQELRKSWEQQTDRVLMVYSKEPVLFCKAGLEEEAFRVVTDTWLDHPNNYLRNEAVRLELAEFLSDRHEYSKAFALLDELRESFSQEFRQNQYATQNWLNYASRADLGDDEDEQRRKLLDVAEYGKSAMHDGDFGRVTDAMQYCLGAIYERAGDYDAAKECYEKAKDTAGEGQFADNIRDWSKRSIDHMNVLKTEPVLTIAATTKDFKPRPWTTSLIVINVVVVIGLLIAFRLRKRKA